MNSQDLKPQQTEAIGHLMEAPSVAEAARRTGVCRATIYNWLKRPAFRAELERARRAEDEARLNQLREMLPAALCTLENLLLSNDERVRLKAASEIVKAYQALASKEPAGATPIEIPDEEWGEETVPLLAKRCMEGLLSGALDTRVAHMAPAYVSMVERALKGDNGGRRDRPFDEEDHARRFEQFLGRLRCDGPSCCDPGLEEPQEDQPL